MKVRDQRNPGPFFSVRVAFDDVPQLYVNPVECIDCGACVPVCKVSAIFALDDLREAEAVCETERELCESRQIHPSRIRYPSIPCLHSRKMNFALCPAIIAAGFVCCRTGCAKPVDGTTTIRGSLRILAPTTVVTVTRKHEI